MGMRKKTSKKDKFSSSEAFESKPNVSLGGNLGTAAEQAYFQKLEQDALKKRQEEKKAEEEKEETKDEEKKAEEEKAKEKAEKKKAEDEEFDKLEIFCPVCKTEKLVNETKMELKFKRCPKCRGVWLRDGVLKFMQEDTGFISKFLDIFKPKKSPKAKKEKK